MSKKPHELFDFLQTVSKGLEDEYQRIQKRATEDPGTAGDQGEENWASILREWLPPTYQVVTKGRILSNKGEASPQVDVIVLHPTYPHFLLDKKLYMAAGIAAAFECKVTLKAHHITDAVSNAVKIKRLLPTRFGSPYRELNSPLIYGLLAHSHTWKGEKSTPAENLENKLVKVDSTVTAHPREMLDLVCVADLATWVLSKTAYLPGFDHVRTAYFDLGLASPVQGDHIKPIGALLYALYMWLAQDDVIMRPLAEYFGEVGLDGIGGGSCEIWPMSVYSEPVRRRIIAEKQKLWDGRYQRGRWDEWAP